MSVSILMVRALVDALERMGVTRARLLSASGLDEKSLESRDLRLSFAEYYRVQIAVLDLSGDEALGLHLGEQMRSSSFDVIGPLAEYATTLRQSVETMVRYSRLLSEAPESSLHEAGDVASIRFGFPRIEDRAIRFASEFSLSALLRLIEHFGGASARPLVVGFAYAAPPHRAEYTRIFGGAERFNHAFTGIDFRREWLDRPHMFENPELYTALESQAERALGRMGRERSMAERVIAQLATQDLKAAPTMDEVARSLGMSARSLRRRLLSEGAVYRTLLERAREHAAKRALARPGASIKETAHALGFATPGAFHRAFKRWTGLTPQEYKASS